MTIITTSEDKMPCSISDGGQSDDQPVDYEIDMTDEWRQFNFENSLGNRINQEIAKLTKSNVTDFRELVSLLKDCKRRDDALAPWRDVVQAAIDLVNAKRHDMYVNITKAEKRLEQSVDQFLSDGHMDP